MTSRATPGQVAALAVLLDRIERGYYCESSEHGTGDALEDSEDWKRLLKLLKYLFPELETAQAVARGENES